MDTRINKELSWARHNLSTGLRLVFFKRIALTDFYVSHDQPLILSVCFSSVFFIGSFFLSLPDPEFSIYGIATVATQLFFLALGAYVFSKRTSTHEHMLPLFVALLSIWPFFHFMWFVLGNSISFNYWELYEEDKLSYLFFNVWLAVVVVRMVLFSLHKAENNPFSIFLIYVAILAAPLNYFNFGGFWYESYEYTEAENKYASINQESTYYRQFQLIDDVKQGMLAQRSGVTDMYFVGFASYADQDVFMKEVQYAKNVLDDKYDTRGRSTALINNIKTLEDVPLASKSNLVLILDHIGHLVDPQEDILFLYLTSHGSDTHQLSISQKPLTLNPIGPEDLKTALDNTPIKYRVILVSACYSGGFIEPLRDDYTLVFTASEKDKTSFGCSNKNDFTYFGGAVFKENMKSSFNLIDNFVKAIDSIRTREKSEDIDPSGPQLYVGIEIRKKLSIFTDEIEKYNRK